VRDAKEMNEKVEMASKTGRNAGYEKEEVKGNIR
jgi:hypothetical protein